MVTVFVKEIVIGEDTIKVTTMPPPHWEGSYPDMLIGRGWDVPGKGDRRVATSVFRRNDYSIGVGFREGGGSADFNSERFPSQTVISGGFKCEFDSRGSTFFHNVECLDLT